MKNVSIIVCCYNSALKLPKTLEHLAQQKVSVDLSYEVIVVDNASTDNTAEFAMSYWGTLNTNVLLRVVREETPGLIYARICGVKAAKNELLIFCDDDNWLREDYVQNAVDIMNTDTTIGALGGQSVLAPGIEAPVWWEEHQGNYAVGKQLPETGNANKRGFVYGAGMVTRTDLARIIFDKQYPFLLTGRKGSQCLSGEDWEYCQRTMMAGYDLYYDERLFYWHDINPSRLTEEQLSKLLHSFEMSSYIQEKYEYAQTFYRHSSLYNLLCLAIRLGNYFASKNHVKGRKKQLLKMHLSMFGLYADKDLDIIKKYIKLSGSSTKYIEI